MKGKKYTTITGRTFICDDVITKQGVTYYKDNYILWSEDKIQGAVKKQYGKSKKVSKKSNGTGGIHGDTE